MSSYKVKIFVLLRKNKKQKTEKRERVKRILFGTFYANYKFFYNYIPKYKFLDL